MVKLRRKMFCSRVTGVDSETNRPIPRILEENTVVAGSRLDQETICRFMWDARSTILRSQTLGPILQ